MGGPIRLDIGAGLKHEAGWVRLDLELVRLKADSNEVSTETKATAPDVACDLMAIPLPDDFADEARAIHVIEHFQPWDAPAAMKEWVRVLKPGAQIAVECPCLDKILKLFDVPNCPPWATYWGLYGDPRLKDPLMMHRWCYTEAHLLKLMAGAGLVGLRGEPPRHHQPIRDMRIVGIKPEQEKRIVVGG